MCLKDLIKPFSPPRRCCEARGSLFNCREWSRKQSFTIVEVLWSSCKPVEVPGKTNRTLLTTLEGPVKLVQACLCEVKTLKSRFNLRGGLWSTCSPVQLPVKISNAVFTTVEVQLCSWKPVYEPERPHKIFLTAEEVLWSTWIPV